MPGPDLDILVSRVVDGAASPADWDALEAAARLDPGVWGTLARAQRDHAALSEAIAADVDHAIAAMSARADFEDMLDRGRGVLRWQGVMPRTVGGWLGWAAAACLGFVMLSPTPGGGAGSGHQASLGGLGTPSLASMISDAAPSAILDLYLDRGYSTGRVVGELPDKVVVESRPLADGRGYEVYYLRQILERTVVEGAFRESRDEFGTLRPVPVRAAPPRAGKL